MEQDSSLKCRLILDGEVGSFSGAVAYIRLERADQADRPSQLVAQEIVRDVSHSQGAEARIEVALPGPREVAADGHYLVRAHVDLDGDGRIGSGDYVSAESYPVLTFGHPSEVSVRVREVR